MSDVSLYEFHPQLQVVSATGPQHNGTPNQLKCYTSCVIEWKVDEWQLQETQPERIERLRDPFDDDEENSDQDDEWEETVESFNRWNFTDVSGLNYGLLEDCKESIDFYELFVNEDIFELIVQETNRYAKAKDPDWTRQELITSIQEAIQKIRPSVIHDLLKSMPSPLLNVVKTRVP
uniref:Uncharacterized protein n=1 Tax=Plectus sambesii TaxID=2011161 RepID=A0A914WQF7_9BILA